LSIAHRGGYFGNLIVR